MAARVSAEAAGPSYASVLNFRGGESNKENIEAAPGEVPDAAPRQDGDEEEEGFVPVIAHGRRPGKHGRRDRERRAPPRPHKAPQPHAEPQPTAEQAAQAAEAQPKKFVEAPIPKVNPWQVSTRCKQTAVRFEFAMRLLSTEGPFVSCSFKTMDSKHFPIRNV